MNMYRVDSSYTLSPLKALFINHSPFGENMLYKITFPYETELEVRVKDNVESILDFARVHCRKGKRCTYEFDAFGMAALRTLIMLYNDCTITIKKHGYIEKEYTCEYFLEYLKLLNGEEHD